MRWEILRVKCGKNERRVKWKMGRNRKVGNCCIQTWARADDCMMKTLLVARGHSNVINYKATCKETIDVVVEVVYLTCCRLSDCGGRNGWPTSELPSPSPSRVKLQLLFIDIDIGIIFIVLYSPYWITRVRPKTMRRIRHAHQRPVPSQRSGP